MPRKRLRSNPRWRTKSRISIRAKLRNTPALPLRRLPPNPLRQRPRRRPRAYAQPPPAPKVTLLDRVMDRLRADRRLGRVKAYTNGGGVVTLYGKVFDDKARHLALATAKSV